MPRDERTFITVHDGMPEHPKVEGLSDAAFRLMVEIWCWCSRNRTDGKIIAASWRKRGSARVRAELVAARLVEETADGVLVHDYTEHQRTAAEIDELKEKRRAAGSKGGKAKASATASASDVAKQTASKVVAETETDTDNEPLRGSDATAQTIVGEWMDRVAKRPPSAVIGQTSRKIRELLEDGIDPNDIRRGLAIWMDKGLHPSALPSAVNEAMNARPTGIRDRPPAGSTADQRTTAGLALAAQLRSEEPHDYREITG